MFRRVLTLLASLATVGVMPGLAVAGTAPPEPAEQPTVDYVFEIDPGEDLAHWVDFALDEAGVAVSKRCLSRLDPDVAAAGPPGDCRTVVGYTAVINGAWLRLTRDESMELGSLAGSAGFRTLTRSWRLTAQWLQADVTPAGSDGRVPAWPDQLTPAGVVRVDGGHDVDYSGVTVGIVDSGIDRFHEDLNVDGGYDCTFEGGPDGWGRDGNGHGTHVAGTIGALDNDRGVEGVAPGVAVRAYKVFGDTGGGSYAAVLCGDDRAMADGVDVVNMSLGGGNDQSVCDSWDSLHTAICNMTAAGLPVVVAAGNDTLDAVSKSPANYPESITVSALATFGVDRPGTNAPPFGCAYPQLDNEIAWFSNTGARVDVIAPGVCVVSSTPDNTYSVASGTSMATPHVTGVIAAAIACGLTADDVLAYAADYNAAWGGDVDYDHEPLAILLDGC